MSRRYYRRRSSASAPGTLLLIVVAATVVGYKQLPAQTVRLIFGCLLLLAGVVIGIVLFVQHKRSQYQQRKLRALSVVDIAAMDGLVFEKYVVELLKIQGYSKVVLTERYDLG